MPFYYSYIYKVIEHISNGKLNYCIPASKNYDTFYIVKGLSINNSIFMDNLKGIMSHRKFHDPIITQNS